MKSSDLPRRGAALGAIAEALRLRGKTTSTPTRKRVFADSTEVSEEAFATQARDVVQRFFTAPYLSSRGFSDDEAREHNDLVVGAVLGCLTSWNTAAALFNAVPDELRQPLAVHPLFALAMEEVLIRTAAYDALFGSRHPVRETLVFLWRKRGIREWWANFEAASTVSLSLHELERRTRVHRVTLKNLKKGELKTDAVLLEIASGLGKLGLQDRHERGFVESRIAFELRVAALVGEVEKMQATLRARELDPEMHTSRWRVVRRELRTLDREAVRDLLVNGFESPVTAELQPALERWGITNLLRLTVIEEARSAHGLRLLQSGRRTEAAALYEARGKAMAEDLRRHATRPHDPAQPMIDFFDWDARYHGAMMRLEPSLPPPPPRLEAEMKAANLLMERVAPWRTGNRSEEEYLREAVAAAPHMVAPRLELSSYLGVVGRHDEAVDLAHALVDEHPSDRPLAVHLVQQLGFAERWREVLERTENHAGPIAERGAALVMLGRLSEAEIELARVLMQNPNDQTALRAKAELLRRIGRRTEAGIVQRRADGLLAAPSERR